MAAMITAADVFNDTSKELDRLEVLRWATLEAIRGVALIPRESDSQTLPKLMVSIADGVYEECVVPPQRPQIYLGCGIVLEMEHEEALAYLQRREREIDAEIDECQRIAAECLAAVD
ncbi:Prefoldin subunit [Giardia muris]|uniref:Prefoldin subunit n=1 Tax=Giardia muris TaxID=5742 RepID=A0A4Z1SX78_GIAMU|nr:Prefoldin subunit [Giardia muris]|eukprot:TNJ26313.1 Prefoldin subunit [Giardia muris]